MFGRTAAKKTIVFCLLIIISLSLSFSGCWNNIVIEEETPDIPEPDKLYIVAAAFAPFDFCRRIAGDKAEVDILIGPGEDSHSYTPTGEDLEKIRSADIFVYTGTEQQLDKMLGTPDNAERQTIDISGLTVLLENTVPDDMKYAFETDDTAVRIPKYDEHVWTSIDNAEIICQEIADVLCDIDEENSEYYRSNCEVYLSELSSLKRNIRRIVSSAERKTIITAGRYSMRYFAEEFELEVFAAYPDCTKLYGTYPEAVRFISDMAVQESIPVVFYDETGDKSTAQKIVDGTDKEIVKFYSCHNISMEDYINNATYIELMTRNAEALEKALN